MKPTREASPVVLLPKSPGTYALIMHLATGRRMTVGKLGRFTFPRGYYLYAGSALGPGGLAGRLKRHMQTAEATNRRPHWHVDYLLEQAAVAEIWFAQGPERQEHVWAAMGRLLDGASVVAPRFGASDCRCQTHLIQTQQRPRLAYFRNLLERKATSVVEVQQYLSPLFKHVRL